MRKFFLPLFILSLFLTPQVVHAQADQRCWTEDACIEARKGLGASESEAKDGFISGTQEVITACLGSEDAASNKLGFCLPVGRSVTQIAFGGKREFLNIGDFIQNIFQYAIGIAGILAVIMIIVAGVQWIASGGNVERITSAKRRIANAIVGLILAVLSVTILNLINPNLVNLRMPQVWMVNTRGIAAAQCSQIEGKKILEYAAASDSLATKEAKQKTILSTNPTFTELPSAAQCGKEYLVEGDGNTCVGSLCSSTGKIRTCLPFDVQSGKKVNTGGTCWTGNLIIYYHIDSFVESIKKSITNWVLGTVEQDGDDHWFQDRTNVSGDASTIDVDNIRVYPVCERPDGTRHTKEPKATTPTYQIIQTNSLREYILQYDIDPAGSFASSCGSDKLYGITIQNELNQQNDTDNYHIFIVQESHGIGGAYRQCDSGWYKKAIPISALEAGKTVYLDVSITGSLLNKLSNESPADDEVDELYDPGESGYDC